MSGALHFSQEGIYWDELILKIKKKIFFDGESSHK